MIYQFLKYLFKLTFETYFKEIRIRGHKKIPNGPVIFVSNHPSTLMDPVVLATLFDRSIFFLAAAEFMGKGAVTKFMQAHLNMIPVYRPDTLPGEAKKNADVFFKCFEHLGNDGAILIFPEGSSKTQRKLRPLKTGSVRIALGAEEETGKTVNIVPIGINYSNPHQFRSQCFVSVGDPLNSKMDELKDCPKEDLAHKFTEIVEKSLQKEVIHIEDEGLHEMFEKVQKIVIHEQQNSEGKQHTQNEKFILGQQIQDALSYFAQNQPEEVQKLSKKLDDYIERVEFYKVTDASISKRDPKVKWSEYFKIIFGLPLYFLGFLSNAVPYLVSSWGFNKIKTNPQFRGSILLMLGLVVFLFWYVLSGVVLANMLGVWWKGIIGIFMMYISGKFTLKYLALVSTWRQKGNWLKVLKRDRNIFESLKNDRAVIVADIMEYDRQFREKTA